MRSFSIMLAVVACLSVMFASCNKHLTSEQIRSEIGGIDWRLDHAMRIHQHGSGSGGGTAASSSTYDIAISLQAPQGFVLPDDSVVRIVGKLTDAIKRAGGKVLEAGQDNGIGYTKHSPNFDQSAFIYKVVYEADGNIGYISGVLVQRRYMNDAEGSLETVGQILLSLHEQR